MNEGGGITAPEGFVCGYARAGLRRAPRNDIALIYSERPCAAAAVFTSNRLKAASIEVSARHLLLSKFTLNAVVINSGNANALTGKEGVRDAERMCKETARLLHVDTTRVAVASTGIIGVPLPMEKVLAGIRSAARRLSASPSAASKAAEAILTTDRVKKETSLTASLSDGRNFTLGGMTKGSGMISPDMQGLHATTLGFITTDAPVERRYLQSCLDKCVEDTYNMVNIDGDMSTNDSIIVMANGRIGGPVVRKDSEFQEALHRLLSSMARMVAMDGEGETRMLEVHVEGARNREVARKAALAVVHSTLVKCAVFGGDPNIGRIASALGASGCNINFSRLSVKIGDVPVIESGKVMMERKRAAAAMRARTVAITIYLNSGQSEAVAYGSDLSYDYVRINSAYST
ncbi:MAG: bifunctional glutamate N-acetyltransferase/amino-acid acetyltransferase ArgJ [Methanomassiliicoccales archaeon]